MDTQYNSSSDTERDSPPPIPPGEEDVTPQTGSSTSVTSSNQWAAAQDGNGSHDPDSMDLDEGSDCEDNTIQYTTPYGNQYTAPHTSQYTIQSGNQYSTESQYPNHYTKDSWYNVQGKDTNQHTTQDTSRYSNQCAPQNSSNDSNQYTSQDTNQYTTKDTSQIVSHPVYYGNNRLPQQQRWVGQWQPLPQQWVGQGYYGNSNNWNNYYQQYYSQHDTTQYNQQQQNQPHSFTHQPYKQVTNKSQPVKQQTLLQYEPVPMQAVSESCDGHVSTPQNR